MHINKIVFILYSKFKNSIGKTGPDLKPPANNLFSVFGRFFIFVFIFRGGMLLLLFHPPLSSTVLLSRVDRVWDFLDVFYLELIASVCKRENKKKCLLVCYTWTHVSAHRSPPHISGSSFLLFLEG